MRDHGNHAIVAPACPEFPKGILPAIFRAATALKISRQYSAPRRIGTAFSNRYTKTIKNRRKRQKTQNRCHF
jgi:hypothetical protein